jgi:hypothetical protein
VASPMPNDSSRSLPPSSGRYRPAHRSTRGKCPGLRRVVVSPATYSTARTRAGLIEPVAFQEAAHRSAQRGGDDVPLETGV